MKACIHRVNRQPRYRQRMPAILVELCCYDWNSGEVSGPRCYDNRHGDSRRASGGDRFRAHPENYAAISATHLRFPRNGLCSLDRFLFIIRTPWPKPGTIVDQTLSAVEITLYITPCIAIHALTYDYVPLVVSRYVSKYLGRDTICVSPA